ncbi:MAG: hypothetical protein IJX65_07020 [Alistipes sp.]|nr:hypothetical protein [Alistipes sp.]
MIRVEYIPQPDALNYLLSIGKRMHFHDKDENQWELFMYLRQSPYAKYLSNESNDHSWFGFQPFTDGRFTLKLSYSKIEVFRNNENIFHHFIRFTSRDGRRWIIKKVIEMIENPSIAKEYARKVAAQKAHQNMIIQTTEDAIRNKLSALGCTAINISFEMSSGGGWQMPIKDIKFRFTYQGSYFQLSLDFNHLSDLLNEIEYLIGDYMKLRSEKRGRIMDTNNLPRDLKWITA